MSLFFFFLFFYFKDIEGEWDKELPEDLDSISPEELEKEINQMIGK